MADAGDLKSPARNGRVGSNPTSAITEDRKQRTEDREKTVIKSVKDLKVYQIAYQLAMEIFEITK